MGEIKRLSNSFCDLQRQAGEIRFAQGISDKGAGVEYW